MRENSDFRVEEEGEEVGGDDEDEDEDGDWDDDDDDDDDNNDDSGIQAIENEIKEMNDCKSYIVKVISREYVLFFFIIFFLFQRCQKMC